MKNSQNTEGLLEFALFWKQSHFPETSTRHIFSLCSASGEGEG